MVGTCVVGDVLGDTVVGGCVDGTTEDGALLGDTVVGAYVEGDCVVGVVLDGKHVLGVSVVGAVVGMIVGAGEVGPLVVGSTLGCNVGDKVEGVELLGMELGTELGQELGSTAGSVVSLNSRLLSVLTKFVAKEEVKALCSVMLLVSMFFVKDGQTGFNNDTNMSKTNGKLRNIISLA
jgi:hypothetical protein